MSHTHTHIYCVVMVYVFSPTNTISSILFVCLLFVLLFVCVSVLLYLHNITCTPLTIPHQLSLCEWFVFSLFLSLFFIVFPFCVSSFIIHHTLMMMMIMKTWKNKVKKKKERKKNGKRVHSNKRACYYATDVTDCSMTLAS